ncbi:MAG: hypothetical protein LBQ24_03265 [Candidatus Peribacteria bacterium]|nr:hypothetical protein [Candidatus Peribacteria bacterium]
MIFPLSNTIIWSAFLIVQILCATIKTTAFFVIAFNACLRAKSVLKSRAEKLSSKM